MYKLSIFHIASLNFPFSLIIHKKQNLGRSALFKEAQKKSDKTARSSKAVFRMETCLSFAAPWLQVLEN